MMKKLLKTLKMNNQCILTQILCFPKVLLVLKKNLQNKPTNLYKKTLIINILSPYLTKLQNNKKIVIKNSNIPKMN